MMVKVHRIKNYSINKNDRFFFDANIWLYIYCSIGDYRKKLVDSYSDFFHEIKTTGGIIYTSSLLISEIANRYSRLEYEIAKKSDNNIEDYKNDFRLNEKYKPIFENINLIIEQKILKNSVPLSDSFDEIEFPKFFDNPHTYDFNDEYYCFLANKNNLKIVTHDRDFFNTKYDIEIITL
ncbi:PIN domain-containing protein [Ureibacillus thermosphaericus]|uniref:Putative nucleic acid-binding protein n=1 Tax=Ureibacillus thermosphaericus TaxID=51173 RepID=A0A840PV83_URETH|nr:PIN domain-containing protein [Ureibacillus thermosphaericus]MBB5148641.1 putative nucleic acid-binding protein [Ureibacillus thermosphaericus]NKZ31356.1 PIN domain-containing protein [Ureibacillus thermosphaericus]